LKSLEAPPDFETEVRSSRHWRGPGGYYQDIIQEAAALWESLSQNHPFIDGNKRVAITLTAAFLKVNGYQLEFDDLNAYAFLMRLYESGNLKFNELEAWLREHTHVTGRL
jgi:death-on-curing protein